MGYFPGKTAEDCENSHSPKAVVARAISPVPSRVQFQRQEIYLQINTRVGNAYPVASFRGQSGKMSTTHLNKNRPKPRPRAATRVAALLLVISAAPLTVQA